MVTPARVPIVRGACGDAAVRSAGPLIAIAIGLQRINVQSNHVPRHRAVHGQRTTACRLSVRPCCRQLRVASGSSCSLEAAARLPSRPRDVARGGAGGAGGQGRLRRSGAGPSGVLPDRSSGTGLARAAATGWGWWRTFCARWRRPMPGHWCWWGQAWAACSGAPGLPCSPGAAARCVGQRTRPGRAPARRPRATHSGRGAKRRTPGRRADCVRARRPAADLGAAAAVVAVVGVDAGGTSWLPRRASRPGVGEPPACRRAHA